MNDMVKTTTDVVEVKWDKIELDLERSGEKIILPNDPGPMSIDDGISALERIKVAENTTYTINEKVDCHFYDGVVAFARALKHKYGFSQAVPTPGFFGSKPPHFIHVKTGPGPNDNIQVPFGSFKLPNISGTLSLSYGESRGIPVLVVGGQVKAKERTIVMEIVNLTKKFSKEQSIYRGKSIILEKDETTDGLNMDEPLRFFDPHAGSEVPIFNKETEELIDVAILTPLRKSAACRTAKIPLKRGILLEGEYGCGKTLTARQVAGVANENNWTFILVSSAQALKYALTFAKMYQPCVVFTEDIDRISDDGRNERANDLINEIDGIVGKNDEIITILTTNFASKIDKAMLRPGRLDTVVSVRPPEAEAVERLIRFYAGDSLDPKSNLEQVKTELAGKIPAAIREVVEKSKLAMLHYGHSKITEKELLVSAAGIRNHLELIARAAEGKRQVPSLEEAFGDIFKTKFGETVRTIVAEELRKAV